MSTIRLPRYLPFANYQRVGLPYHGLVSGIDVDKEGTLTLPDSTTMKYRQALNGDTVLVRSAGASATVEEIVGPYRWRNYALLSGDTRRIADQDLGRFGWLYCDDNATWWMSLTSTQNSSGSITIRVYVESLFGYFSNVRKTMTRTQIGTLTFTPKKPNGDSAPAIPFANAWNSIHQMTHSATGAKTILNIGGNGYWTATPAVINLHAQVTAAQASAISSGSYVGGTGWHTAVQIVLAGNGSLTGTIGDGITATLSLARQGDGMVTAYSGTYTGNDQATWESHYTAAYLDVVLADGTMANLSFDADILQEYTTGDGLSSYTERNDTRGFSIGTFSWSGTFAYTKTVTDLGGGDTDEVYTYAEDGVTLAGADEVSLPTISCIAWVYSVDCGENPVFVYPTGKYYGSMMFFCRTLNPTVADTGRKSKLISLSTFDAADVDKPAGVYWIPSRIAGNNCSHDPVAGTFSYDLTVDPFYCEPSGVTAITDAINNTVRSYV